MICSDCPGCYNEVQRQVHVVRSQLTALREIVEYLETRPPETINDTTFIDQMAALNASVNELVENSVSHGMFSHVVHQPLSYRNGRILITDSRKAIDLFCDAIAQNILPK